MMVLTTRAMAVVGKQVQAGGTLNAYPDAASMPSYAKDSAAVVKAISLIETELGYFFLAPKQKKGPSQRGQVQSLY